jgi:hypothetical protein
MPRSYLRVSSKYNRSSELIFFDDDREENVIEVINQAQDLRKQIEGTIAIARMPSCTYTLSVQRALREVKLILERCPPGDHIFIQQDPSQSRVCSRCWVAEPRSRGLSMFERPQKRNSTQRKGDS